MHPTIYTIGHSNHSLERFVELLIGAGINAVADVRSAPFSRYVPHFNRERIGPSLKLSKIVYVFLGDQLGARPDHTECYRDGRVDFELVATSEAFRLGLKRVYDGAREHRIALMCAEKDPVDCHRNILVARALQGKGAVIRHILADGRIEESSDTERRLLELTGLDQGDLFSDTSMDPVSTAYQLRGREIAHAGELHGRTEED